MAKRKSKATPSQLRQRADAAQKNLADDKTFYGSRPMLPAEPKQAKPISSPLKAMESVAKSIEYAAPMMATSFLDTAGTIGKGLSTAYAMATQQIDEPTQKQYQQMMVDSYTPTLEDVTKLVKQGAQYAMSAVSGSTPEEDKPIPVLAKVERSQLPKDYTEGQTQDAGNITPLMQKGLDAISEGYQAFTKMGQQAQSIATEKGRQATRRGTANRKAREVRQAVAKRAKQQPVPKARPGDIGPTPFAMLNQQMAGMRGVAIEQADGADFEDWQQLAQQDMAFEDQSDSSGTFNEHAVNVIERMAGQVANLTMRLRLVEDLLDRIGAD